MTASTQMPRYRCHKEVWALQIKAIDLDFRTLSFVDPLFAPREVSQEYLDKHKPFARGYFVQYADGYESFSPQKAFEEGYTRV